MGHRENRKERGEEGQRGGQREVRVLEDNVGEKAAICRREGSNM